MSRGEKMGNEQKMINNVWTKQELNYSLFKLKPLKNYKSKLKVEV